MRGLTRDTSRRLAGDITATGQPPKKKKTANGGCVSRPQKNEAKKNGVQGNTLAAGKPEDESARKVANNGKEGCRCEDGT
jgi:hypothetical protein